MADIRDITMDSRRCVKDTVFFAFPPMGHGRSGDLFIEDAISRGSRTVVCARSKDTENLARRYPDVRFLFRKSPQEEFSRRAARICGNPQQKLRIIGITGTDGKTTTAFFLYTLLKNLGIKAGILSTVYLDDGSGITDSPYRQSTPEADVLFPFLSRCARNGVDTVVLEATSHALSPRTARLGPIVFEGAVYTTISSEHLDFHGSLQAYVGDKLNLARRTRKGGFVLSPSDGTYNDMIRQACPQAVFDTYTASSVRVLRRDLESTVIGAGDGKEVMFPYGEEVFLQNAVGALRAASLISGRELGFGELSGIARVKGRMQVIRTGRGLFVIDFAHTADAYERLMRFVTAAEKGRKICAVVSSGGQRDIGKRAMMGRICARYCSVIIITSEDPRDEGFSPVAADILEGIGVCPARVLQIPDRTEAIRTAVKLSDARTVTLLLGKGHEKTIEFQGGKKVPWDEEAVLQEALSRWE